MSDYENDIRKIKRELKNGELKVIDVPELYRNDLELVRFERKLGLRLTGKRGYDVISDTFFVHETIVYTSDLDGSEERETLNLQFDDFKSFYVFLDGNVYEDACYTFWDYAKEDLNGLDINIEKLMERKAFTEERIDDFTLAPSENEKNDYNDAERAHKLCKKWIEKFNACASCEEITKTVDKYRKSKLCEKVDLSFFFSNYIFADPKDLNRFLAIMEYVSNGAYPSYRMINELCSIYDPDLILKFYDYQGGSKHTRYRRKKELKEYVEQLKAGEIVFYSKAYFDKITHYYCFKKKGYHNGIPVTNVYRFFETFDEFTGFLNGDLRNCDLTESRELDVDFSKYITDETTKLPISAYKNPKYAVAKRYKDNVFYVTILWGDRYGNIIKRYDRDYRYFFDFVAFLKGNLRDANLLFCDGLQNLKIWDSIDFTGAMMRSTLCEKFGVNYKRYSLKEKLLGSFGNVDQNERETSDALATMREISVEAEEKGLTKIQAEWSSNCQRVFYISDLHLLHRIHNFDARSDMYVKYVVQKIVDTIVTDLKGSGDLLLIDGDVSSSFDIFEMFVKILSHAKGRLTTVVFTLGNHELWDFPGIEIHEIVNRYRSLIEGNGMYLLYNDLLYREDKSDYFEGPGNIHIIKYDELCKMDNNQLQDRLKSSRYVILGGTGFSGYNSEFNAINEIYRATLNREREIGETQKFEMLYNRLQPILSKKNTVIMTHMPKADWHRNPSPDKGLVYVSGHTHRNAFYDDGEYRVYADNQIGYRAETPHLKSLLIDDDYDCFDNYDDGIYEITREQYCDFHRGKNIPMTFKRKINKLYMLKKRGYYCFIHESKEGTLAILNGGSMKNLNRKNIQYYYDNMDAVISRIKTPLSTYTAYQKQIATFIKQIGGDGTIHGCIIDIDFCNHIYVNPLNGITTAYWASDIINKHVFNSAQALLEANCPKLYSNYLKAIETSGDNPLATRTQMQESDLTTESYLSTDIYRASREVRKMQRLHVNILTLWYEIKANHEKQIENT